MDTMSHCAPASGWRTMAMIEVDGAPEALDDVHADVRRNCRLHPAPSSGEKPRFYLVADASRGKAQALRSVALMLMALDAIAGSGGVRAFRVVAAEERLVLKASVRRDGVARSRDTPCETSATADLRWAALA